MSITIDDLLVKYNKFGRSVPSDWHGERLSYAYMRMRPHVADYIRQNAITFKNYRIWAEEQIAIQEKIIEARAPGTLRKAYQTKLLLRFGLDYLMDGTDE